MQKNIQWKMRLCSVFCTLFHYVLINRESWCARSKQKQSLIEKVLKSFDPSMSHACLLNVVMISWWGQGFCPRMSILPWSSWGTSLAVRWRIASLWWWYCCRCRTQLYIHPAQATLLSERTCRKQKSSGCTQPAVPCLGTGCGTRHHLRHYLL